MKYYRNVMEAFQYHCQSQVRMPFAIIITQVQMPFQIPIAQVPMPLNRCQYQAASDDDGVIV